MPFDFQYFPQHENALYLDKSLGALDRMPITTHRPPSADESVLLLSDTRKHQRRHGMYSSWDTSIYKVSLAL